MLPHSCDIIDWSGYHEETQISWFGNTCQTLTKENSSLREDQHLVDAMDVLPPKSVMKDMPAVVTENVKGLLSYLSHIHQSLLQGQLSLHRHVDSNGILTTYQNVASSTNTLSIVSFLSLNVPHSVLRKAVFKSPSRFCMAGQQYFCTAFQIKVFIRS